jgi:hypothetical protein
MCQRRPDGAAQTRITLSERATGSARSCRVHDEVTVTASDRGRRESARRVRGLAAREVAAPRVALGEHEQERGLIGAVEAQRGVVAGPARGLEIAERVTNDRAAVTRWQIEDRAPVGAVQPQPGGEREDDRRRARRERERSHPPPGSRGRKHDRESSNRRARARRASPGGCARGRLRRARRRVVSPCNVQRPRARPRATTRLSARSGELAGTVAASAVVARALLEAPACRTLRRTVDREHRARGLEESRE